MNSLVLSNFNLLNLESIVEQVKELAHEKGTVDNEMLLSIGVRSARRD